MTQIAVAVVLVSSCDTSRHTVTADHAFRRIDGYLQETLRSVATPLRFSERVRDDENGGGCTRPLTDSGFTGQIKPVLTYKAAVTSEDDVRAFFTAVASSWKEKSASVTTSPAPDGTPDSLRIDLPDDYILRVSYYPYSHLVQLLGSLDKCIWTNGTPQPDDDP